MYKVIIEVEEPWVGTFVLGCVREVAVWDIGRGDVGTGGFALFASGESGSVQ